MTGSNPGHPQDGQGNETVQWWSTPPASTSPGAPITGTEPTILGGQHGPVTGSDPTVLGAGFDSYRGVQQPPPHYAQPGYPPQQPYPGAPYPPQPGYPGPQFPPPPPGRSSSAGWIIGGVLGLVVIVGVVVGAVVLTQKSDSGGGGVAGTDKKKVDGSYSMANVTNACSLVDPTVLRKWAPNQKGQPEHTERAPDANYGGGSLDCRAAYDGAGKYGSQGSDLKLEVSFQSQYGTPQFNSWKEYDTKTTGSGRDSGPLPGLGEQAYWATYEQTYGSFVNLDYTCAVLDSNLSAKLKLSVETPTATSKDEVGAICKDQLKKAITTLHK
ncbi:hypothetical protein NDR87_34310 [Nocardia sp. CDC159]|uniref:DUF3558 domain-containing protein n=1 Tax=Nocardia pulmonis TaxID=2951408 RepID=A0A9X2J0H6_9NOCA|nr:MULTISPECIES: hypothetical protein [Nocardia]MCM6778568.1 hypothetical protein [Nocardia pulmonis]MCM6791457.1 hypothetical protein [Nocardia sp. CDC159]